MSCEPKSGFGYLCRNSDVKETSVRFRERQIPLRGPMNFMQTKGEPEDKKVASFPEAENFIDYQLINEVSKKYIT